LYAASETAAATQERLSLLIRHHQTAKAIRVRSRFELRLLDEDKEPIGALSRHVNHDLNGIANEIGRRLSLPKEIWNVNVVGVRTVVLAEDNSACEMLHEPYRRTGIFLSPVVLALTKAHFER
jgi:hypothetical protein